MMPTPFILNDAVVINVLNRRHHRFFRATSYPIQQKKASRIIKVDSLKVE
jgi:hypothetical protein